MNRQNSNKGRGFSTKSSYVQTNKLQDTTTYDHYNQYFADSVVRIVGCSVQVTTVDGHVYDGILETISPKCEVCLRSAHLQADLNKPKLEQFMNPTNESIKNIKFDFRNVIRIKCKNVDWDFPEKDSFHTDTMISGSNGPISTERELKPWTADTDDTNIGHLEEITEISNGDTYTDLKRANEEKFAFQSSYTDSVMDTYMDRIETHDPQLHRERSEKAAKAAREIEQKQSYKMHEKLDSGLSEEERFSSVNRPATQHASQARNSGYGRGRGGRARGSNFQGGSEGFDPQYNGRPQKYGGNSVKRSEPVEQSGSKLYSDFFKNEPGNQQQQQHPPQQQMAPCHQTIRQEPFHQPDDNKLPPAVQLEAQERSMGGQLSQGMGTSYQDSIPPRMQQKHHNQLAASSRLQPAQKLHNPPQRDPLSPQGDVVDGERKLKSIDSANSFGAPATGSSDRKARFTPVQQKPALSDYPAKTTVEGTRNKMEQQPRSKFGKIRQEEEARRQTDIGDLKKFREQFTLATPGNKQMMKPRDTLTQETADANGEVAQVTSELPLKAISGPGDLKAATPWQKVQDMRLDEKEVNEKGYIRTEGNQVEPGLTTEEPQTVSTPIKAKNPGDAPSTGSKDTSEGKVVIELTPEPKSIENKPSEKALNKVAEEKKPSDAKEPASLPEQKQTPVVKTKLNPNAGEFVPRSAMPSPASSSSHHPTVSAPSQPPVAVTSFQSNVPGHPIPVLHQRVRGNSHQNAYAVSDASPQVYPSYLPQGVQSQHSQPPVVQYIIVPQGANPGFGNQSQFVRPIQSQGYAQPQIVSPFLHGEQNLYVMQAGNQMLHQQQQQTPLHQHGAIHSHPSTPSQQQPQMHFVMHTGNPQYPQIASPMQSNPQGTPGPHPRPPTPSQHPIHPSATPPLHPVGGQQTLYYPQGPVQNVPPQPYVATQRPQHISPFQ